MHHLLSGQGLFPLEVHVYNSQYKLPTFLQGLNTVRGSLGLLIRSLGVELTLDQGNQPLTATQVISMCLTSLCVSLGAVFL